MTLREIDSPIDGHPNPALGFPFFDAATGSLGQGLSVAGGLGCAARIDGIDKVVYCIIGDGESREGQIWEAMDFIRDQRLSNVVALFNCNELGQSDFVSRQQDWTHLQRKAEATRGNAFFKHEPSVPDAAITDEYLVSQMLIAGTVNQVVDKLLAFYEDMGGFGTLLYCGHDWADAGAMRRSMELMAEEVLPRVNRALP